VQIAEIDSNIARLRKDLGNMRTKVTEYTKVADAERAQGAGAEIKQVDMNILKMNQKVAALQKEVDGLYNQRSAITLG
jgi:predicted  nucleic acid-binding Zn-ribbon protein